MNPYFPVAIIFVIGLGLAAILTSLGALLGPKKATAVKKEIFECGVPQVSSKDRMSVKYYLTAILFILFDIETIFIYLWAKVFRELAWLGMIEMAIFMAILLIGYYYVLKKGALDWES